MWNKKFGKAACSFLFKNTLFMDGFGFSKTGLQSSLCLEAERDPVPALQWDQGQGDHHQVRDRSAAHPAEGHWQGGLHKVWHIFEKIRISFENHIAK